MKLTPWFDHKKRPVHVGVYQVLPPRWCRDHTLYAYWNGRWWGLFSYDPGWAPVYKTMRNDIQRMKWRGLTEKPE